MRNYVSIEASNLLEKVARENTMQLLGSISTEMYSQVKLKQMKK